MKQNRFLYTMKLIACLAVITIHVRFPDPVGHYVTALARFAVPFFFAVSGRYLLVYSNTTQEIRRSALKSLKKLLKITAVVYVVYQIYSLIYHLIIGTDIPELLKERFNAASFKRFLSFNAGKVIYDDSYVFDHMWYLFAIIYVMIFIAVLAPAIRKCYKPLTAVLLLCLHIFTWIQDFRTIRIPGLTLTTWYVLRSWLFTGIPYVLLGIIWGDMVEKLKKDKTIEDYSKVVKLWLVPGSCILSIGIISTCFEAYLIGAKDIYIGSLLMVIGILLLSEPLCERGRLFWKVGKEASSNIYFYHVLILAIINFGADRGVLIKIPDAVKTMAVMAISVIIFYVLPKLYRSVINVKKG